LYDAQTGLASVLHGLGQHASQPAIQKIAPITKIPTPNDKIVRFMFPSLSLKNNNGTKKEIFTNLAEFP
jgi:hypothetical protein